MTTRKRTSVCLAGGNKRDSFDARKQAMEMYLLLSKFHISVVRSKFPLFRLFAFTNR